MRRFVIALLAIIVFSGTLGAQTATERRAVEQFEQAVASYARLHQELDRTLGPLPASADALAAQRGIESRADAIRRVRPEPRQGALFTKELATVIRRNIADTLRTNRLTPADVLFDEAAVGNEGAPLIMRVNAPFPWQGAIGMPLCVNNVLPQLPNELQYRFVDRNLVLVDVVSSLIVDILPQALPPAGRTR